MKRWTFATYMLVAGCLFSFGCGLYFALRGDAGSAVVFIGFAIVGSFLTEFTKEL